MRLLNCHAENFMGLSELKLNLDHNLIAILADNGQGKSSVLKAIKVVLGAWLQGVTEPDVSVPQIERYMMRRALVPSGFDLVEELVGGACVSASAKFPKELVIDWSRSRATKANSITNRVDSKSLKVYAEDQLATSNTVLPLIAYFGARRSVPPDIRVVEHKPVSRQQGYVKTMQSSIDFGERFGRWRRLRDQSASDPRAKHVLDGLHNMLVMLLPGAVRVSYDPSLNQPVVEFEERSAGGGMRAFSSLSDGYQNILGIGLDLGLRAIQLNPQLNGDAICQTPGVVLIDEIDQHLHPAWQSQIASSMSRAFPEMQFILATHSASVALDVADSGQVIHLSSVEGGVVAHELSARDLGPTVGQALLGHAFNVPTTWAPDVVRMVEERALILDQHSAEYGELQQPSVSALAALTSELEDRLGGEPISSVEDEVRRVLRTLAFEIGAASKEELGKLRKRVAEDVRIRLGRTHD